MLPDPAVQPTMTAAEAAALFGASSDAWYGAIRGGQCPVPVLRIGRLIKHPTMAVLRILELVPSMDEGPAATGPIATTTDDQAALTNGKVRLHVATPGI